MEKKLTARDVIMRASAALLCLVMAVQLVRAGTNEILYKKLGIRNEIVVSVLTGLPWLERAAEGRSDVPSVDWQKLYPFEGETQTLKKHNLIEKIYGKIISGRNKISLWTNERLAGYYTLVEERYKYEKAVGWRTIPVIDNIRPYRGDFFVESVRRASEKEVEERVRQVTGFAEFLKEKNIPLLYVQAPYKMSREDEKVHREQWKSYANDNADALLAGLRADGVDTLDLRDALEKEDTVWQNFFFYTDHHWKPETAFWATRIVVDALTQKASWNFQYERELLAPSAYTQKRYEKIFLGSLGRRVTLAYATPEDITLFYPKAETRFALDIPSIGLSKVGDFSVQYDQSQLQGGSFYSLDPYSSYIYGPKPYVNIMNMDNPNGKHFLVVGDSFSRSMAMFLARTLSRLELIDLRRFTGSLRSFINEQKPDGVLILYNASEISPCPIEWTTHEDIFDFR